MEVDAGDRVPLLAALLFHVLASIGYVYFAPTAVAFVSKAAPPRLNAMIIGIYYLTIFFGGVISGRLGGLYERLPPSAFWLVHAGIVATGGLLLLIAPCARTCLSHELPQGSHSAAPTHAPARHSAYRRSVPLRSKVLPTSFVNGAPIDCAESAPELSDCPRMKLPW